MLAAIRKMSPTSSPGPDMLMVKFYQVHYKALVSIFIQTFNLIILLQQSAPSLVKSFTTFLPKKCSSITEFDMRGRLQNPIPNINYSNFQRFSARRSYLRVSF
eukprot:TRINITY_DN4755_c0_g3_i1.p1 TRINITY_DN4755_c0_g3~~TRINITY_DN4755_c0_g3_i1.p1  ORF type:complete len:103 (-),score=8.16 TRINITY_DN4755_c0_g3_i1:626-934(-)